MKTGDRGGGEAVPQVDVFCCEGKEFFGKGRIGLDVMPVGVEAEEGFKDCCRAELGAIRHC
eukprot:8571945-Ditylum_brightwellii.AAC.1